MKASIVFSVLIAISVGTIEESSASPLLMKSAKQRNLLDPSAFESILNFPVSSRQAVGNVESLLRARKLSLPKSLKAELESYYDDLIIMMNAAGSVDVVMIGAADRSYAEASVTAAVGSFFDFLKILDALKLKDGHKARILTATLLTVPDFQLYPETYLAFLSKLMPGLKERDARYLTSQSQDLGYHYQNVVFQRLVYTRVGLFGVTMASMLSGFVASAKGAPHVGYYVPGALAFTLFLLATAFHQPLEKFFAEKMERAALRRLAETRFRPLVRQVRRSCSNFFKLEGIL